MARRLALEEGLLVNFSLHALWGSRTLNIMLNKSKTYLLGFSLLATRIHHNSLEKGYWIGIGSWFSLSEKWRSGFGSIWYPVLNTPRGGSILMIWYFLYYSILSQWISTIWDMSSYFKNVWEIEFCGWYLKSLKC